MCALLDNYAAQNSNSVPTFRDNLMVPYSRVKTSFLDFLTLEYGTDGLRRNIGKKASLRSFVISQKSADLNDSLVLHLIYILQGSLQ